MEVHRGMLTNEQVEALRIILQQYVENGTPLSTIADTILAVDRPHAELSEDERRKVNRFRANLQNFIQRKGKKQPSWQATLEPIYTFAQENLRARPISDPIIINQLKVLFGGEEHVKTKLAVHEAINAFFGSTEANNRAISETFSGYYRCYRYSSVKGRIAKTLLRIHEFDDDNHLSKFTHWYVRDGSDRISSGVNFKLGQMIHMIGKLEPNIGLHYMSLDAPDLKCLRGIVKYVTYLRQSIFARVLCIRDEGIKNRENVEIGVYSASELSEEIGEYSQSFRNLLDNYADTETAFNILSGPLRPD
jgi:hypothetical protein